jgi:hypothetical protein
MLSGMFENIDINYIVIGLIVLTLVCIYLLYNSLSSGGDSLELKKHINELVLQNKKRDEIIHFLVNQVQLLQSQPPITEITAHEEFKQTNIEPTTVATHNERVTTDVKSNINTEEMVKLDQLLEADFTTTKVEITEPVENTTTQKNLDSNNTDNENVNNVDNNQDVSTDEESLVDTVLSNDKLPPKDKDLLYVYTVSQLKDYAKELSISTGGSKDVLINRIFEAL